MQEETITIYRNSEPIRVRKSVAEKHGIKDGAHLFNELANRVISDHIRAGFNAEPPAPPKRRYLITQPNVNEPYFADSYPDIMPEDGVVYDLHENRHLIDGEWFDVEVV
jgi:hypothetical protein